MSIQANDAVSDVWRSTLDLRSIETVSALVVVEDLGWEHEVVDVEEGAECIALRYVFSRRIHQTAHLTMTAEQVRPVAVESAASKP